MDAQDPPLEPRRFDINTLLFSETLNWWTTADHTPITFNSFDPGIEDNSKKERDRKERADQEKKGCWRWEEHLGSNGQKLATIWFYSSCSNFSQIYSLWIVSMRKHFDSIWRPWEIIPCSFVTVAMERRVDIRAEHTTWTLDRPGRAEQARGTEQNLEGAQQQGTWSSKSQTPTGQRNPLTLMRHVPQKDLLHFSEWHNFTYWDTKDDLMLKHRNWLQTTFMHYSLRSDSMWHSLNGTLRLCEWNSTLTTYWSDADKPDRIFA